MPVASQEKSTNVRFLVALVTACGLCGCAAPPPAAAERSACSVEHEVVCTSFGPARSCECVPRTEVDRFLSSFGEPAWLGGKH